jgi:tetratricopeptide (TPR) repeat protein
MITIDDAISYSERRAKRLSLIGLVWIVMMLAVASIFGVSVYQFNDTRRELDHLKSTADQLIADLEKTKDELSILKNKGSSQSKQIYALSLQILGSNTLTSEQKEFVKRQAQEAAREQPTPNSLTVQAASELIKGDFQQAFDTYTEAVSLDPQFAEAYAGRANVDLMLNDVGKGYDDLTQALTVDKDLSHRPFLLARRSSALLTLGRIEEAERDAAEASGSDDPTGRGYALNSRGFIKLVKKDWEGAQADFRAAAALLPDQKRFALENIGIIYLVQSKWTEAYDWSLELSKMNDATGGWVWLIEALAAERLGKDQERQAAVQEFMNNVWAPESNVRELSRYLPGDLAQLARSWVLPADK